jgi:hypothetical protein
MIMNDYEEFEQKYPDIKLFEKDFPIGKEIKYFGGELLHIVSHFEDDNELFVVAKSWNKWKNKWCYEVHSAFGLVDGLEMLEEKRAKKSV